MFAHCTWHSSTFVSTALQLNLSIKSAIRGIKNKMNTKQIFWVHNNCGRYRKLKYLMGSSTIDVMYTFIHTTISAVLTHRPDGHLSGGCPVKFGCMVNITTH